MINFSRPKHLFYLLFILLLLSVIYLAVNAIYSEDAIIETYGVNKTIGWAWDLCNFVPLIFGFSFIVNVLGYGLLALIKSRINRWIIIIQMTSILMTIIIWFMRHSYDFCTTVLIISILTLILFFVNLGFAIACKLYDKNKRLDD
jgi:hypothetical protein